MTDTDATRTRQGDARLRPCPFCGSEAELLYHPLCHADPSHRSWQVRCASCGARVGSTVYGCGKTREHVTATWNRRTTCDHMSRDVYGLLYDEGFVVVYVPEDVEVRHVMLKPERIGGLPGDLTWRHYVPQGERESTPDGERLLERVRELGIEVDS